MNKMRRYFFLDTGLLLLLVVNLSTLGGGRAGTSFGAELRNHLHAISGIGLMFASLVHITLHLPWFRAVVTGKAKGRIKLIMYSMVAVFFLLAFLSAPAADVSTAAGRFHEWTGALAVAGMVIHSLKHLRWMVSAGRIILAGRPDDASAAIVVTRSISGHAK